MNDKTYTEVFRSAYIILDSYNKGNGSYNLKLNDVDWCANDVDWLLAYSIFELSKLDNTTFAELRRLRAVSIKHSLLLAKTSTGKYDFTSLLEHCSFINKIDVNLQCFTFKRETKNLKVDLDLLTAQLELLGLDLITEEQVTRSGSVVINYFYDIKTTKK
jgi:hypothetical protein